MLAYYITGSSPVLTTKQTNMTVTLEFDLTNPEDDIKLSRALAADRMLTALQEIDQAIRNRVKYADDSPEIREAFIELRDQYYQLINENKIDLEL